MRGSGRAPRGLHGSAKLRLTSMMDILVVLLLFLLKSFVVEGETVTPPPGVKLPESTSRELPRESVQVAIHDGGISVGGRFVTPVAELDNDDLYIATLGEELVRVRAQMDDLAVRQGGESASPTATVQGDRSLEYRVLQRVMFTLSQAGFEDISLAVIKTA